MPSHTQTYVPLRLQASTCEIETPDIYGANFLNPAIPASGFTQENVGFTSFMFVSESGTLPHTTRFIQNFQMHVQSECKLPGVSPSHAYLRMQIIQSDNTIIDVDYNEDRDTISEYYSKAIDKFLYSLNINLDTMAEPGNDPTGMPTYWKMIPIRSTIHNAKSLALANRYSVSSDTLFPINVELPPNQNDLSFKIRFYVFFVYINLHQCSDEFTPGGLPAFYAITRNFFVQYNDFEVVETNTFTDNARLFRLPYFIENMGVMTTANTMVDPEAVGIGPGNDSPFLVLLTSLMNDPGSSTYSSATANQKTNILIMTTEDINTIASIFHTY